MLNNFQDHNTLLMFFTTLCDWSHELISLVFLKLCDSWPPFPKPSLLSWTQTPPINEMMQYLAYFTKHKVLQVQPCCNKWQNLLCLKAWTVFHGILCTSFSSSFHPCRTNILATVNNAEVLFKILILFSLDICPGMRLLNHSLCF